MDNKKDKKGPKGAQIWNPKGPKMGPKRPKNGPTRTNRHQRIEQRGPKKAQKRGKWTKMDQILDQLKV